MLRPLFEAKIDKVNWAHLLVSSAQAEQRTEANPEKIIWGELFCDSVRLKGNCLAKPINFNVY